MGAYEPKETLQSYEKMHMQKKYNTGYQLADKIFNRLMNKYGEAKAQEIVSCAVFDENDLCDECGICEEEGWFKGDYYPSICSIYWINEEIIPTMTDIIVFGYGWDELDKITIKDELRMELTKCYLDGDFYE